MGGCPYDMDAALITKILRPSMQFSQEWSVLQVESIAGTNGMSIALLSSLCIHDLFAKGLNGC